MRLLLPQWTHTKKSIAVRWRANLLWRFDRFLLRDFGEICTEAQAFL